MDYYNYLLLPRIAISMSEIRGLKSSFTSWLRGRIEMGCERAHKRLDSTLRIGRRYVHYQDLAVQLLDDVVEVVR